ncbi:MAG: pyrroline-5-carboxylate reductase [Pasteurellaceae bacterium]|nr:pyrroline-5-carboxylate reductase [Pasteurellaceae bacterium]
MQQKRITFIGGGNMAQAIVLGLLKQGYHAENMLVCDPNEEKRTLFIEQGVQANTDNQTAVKKADVILLAVKPQAIATVCHQLSNLDFSDKLVISIAAGISIKRIQTLLPTAQHIVRAMPNTPALVSTGMTGLYAPAQLSNALKNFTSDLLSSIGEVCWFEQEQQMHAVTAASGSSPAYFFLLMEAMQKALLEMGLNTEQARQLIQQSALGAAQMVIQNPQCDIAELRQNVTSKGGTTAAALTVFEQHNFAQLVQQAMQACVQRSKEMESLF